MTDEAEGKEMPYSVTLLDGAGTSALPSGPRALSPSSRPVVFKVRPQTRDLVGSAGARALWRGPSACVLTTLPVDPEARSGVAGSPRPFPLLGLSVGQQLPCAHY